MSRGDGHTGRRFMCCPTGLKPRIRQSPYYRVPASAAATAFQGMIMHLAIVLAAVVFLFSPAHADEQTEAAYDFIAGPYVCVGKRPDSNRTYAGRVDISRQGDGVRLVRTIDAQRVEASGSFGTATADKIPVLRVKFKQHGVAYEETCMVDSDPDNYARLTCYLYSEKTTTVGLEALFPDHGQLVR